jgi:hypothetical protein
MQRCCALFETLTFWDCFLTGYDLPGTILITYKELGMEKQYTNKLTPEVLAEFAQSPFSAEDLAAMDDEARARCRK